MAVGFVLFYRLRSCLHLGLWWCRCSWCAGWPCEMPLMSQSRFFHLSRRAFLIRSQSGRASYLVSVIFCIQLCFFLFFGSWHRFDELCGIRSYKIRCSLCARTIHHAWFTAAFRFLICFHSAIVRKKIIASLFVSCS